MRIDYFLGVGQGDKVQKILAMRLPELHFHAAPNYLVGKNDAEFLAVGLNAVSAALDGARPVIVCAESQAAPAVVEAIVSGKIAQPKTLVLIQPLGLNPGCLGSSKPAQKTELLRRSRAFWRHKNQSLFIPGNAWTAMYLLKQSVRHILKLPSAYEFGASQDIRSALVALADKIEVKIFASNDDSLFPYHEIVKENPELGAKIYKLSGTHLNRATPLGREQLSEILRRL